MESSIRHENNVGVISLTGRLDSGAAPLFEEWFTGQDRPECTRYLMDMSGMPYITSAGLRSILKLAKLLETRGGILAFCAMNAPVQDLFRISGFTSFLSIYDSREQALAALAA